MHKTYLPHVHPPATHILYILFDFGAGCLYYHKCMCEVAYIYNLSVLLCYLTTIGHAKCMYMYIYNTYTHCHTYHQSASLSGNGSINAASYTKHIATTGLEDYSVLMCLLLQLP